MKLTTSSKRTIPVVKNVEGLLNLSLEHEIEKSKGDLQYFGPKIPRSMWGQVMGFFQWTFKSMASESQVRLFVNIQRNTWAAWAFPQEAKTGMSAREIEAEDWKVQRAQFPDSEGWMYFGTVHHHCDCSAFQSPKDFNNEKNQDGLHITVGRMDGVQHDLHARFYVQGCEFEVDMTAFWDIGLESNGLIPPHMFDGIARFQMGSTPYEAFPPTWRTNVREIKEVVAVGFQNGGNGGNASSHFTPPTKNDFIAHWKRVETALEEVEKKAESLGISDVNLENVLKFLSSTEIVRDIFRICDANRVMPDLLYPELIKKQDGEMEVSNLHHS